MSSKRKQYKVMQFKFDDITEKDEKLTIAAEPRLVMNSENLFYDLICSLRNKNNDTVNIDNHVFDEFIILKVLPPTLTDG